MKFNIIASGSKGNATLVKYKETVILIDMGITFLRLQEGLKEFNLNDKDINAIIVTHNHTDHVNGLRYLSPKICYALEGTLPSLSNVINKLEPFFIGEFKITALPTSHDGINPCGYMLETEDEKLVYLTDLGIFDDSYIDLIRNPDYLILESNHDIPMLMASNRSDYLKARIASEHGHLSNENSAIAASKIYGEKTKEVILAHLSEECNTPEKALNAYKNIFEKLNLPITFELRCANQHYSTLGGNLNEH